MKNSAKTSIIVIAILVLIVFLFFKSCVIYHPKPSECQTVTVKITELREGPTYDIQFKSANGQTFYINRGIELGLNLDSLNAKVLNKTVTLHLPKMIYGPSKHIAQLEMKDEIIYTEFKD